MTPLEKINALLGIDAITTLAGDELKVWINDGEGGRCKTYLGENDCRELGACFSALGKTLRKAALEKESTDT